MHNASMYLSKDLTAASASPLILLILSESDNYGYAIIKRVSELSDGELLWTEGMLYPVLHRLEEAGSISAYWSDSNLGRKRKYYHISEAGRQELKNMMEQWTMVNNALERAWKGR